jgi:hypothetical protein
MIAARTLRERFGHSVEEDVLRAWIADLEGRTPSLRELVDVALDAPEYKKLVPASLAVHVRDMRASITEELLDEEPSDERDDDGATETEGAAPALPRAIAEALVLARDLARTEVSPAIGAARALSTETLCLVTEPEHFVPVLDASLEDGVVPDDLERVVEAARALGLDPNVVYDRIGQALEQLRAMILGGSHDADRYARLVDRVKGIPDEMFDELAACATESGNLEAIAALLAVDLGGTAARVPGELVTDALGTAAGSSTRCAPRSRPRRRRR